MAECREYWRKHLKNRVPARPFDREMEKCLRLTSWSCARPAARCRHENEHIGVASDMGSNTSFSASVKARRQQDVECPDCQLGGSLEIFGWRIWYPCRGPSVQRHLMHLNFRHYCGSRRGVICNLLSNPSEKIRVVPPTVTVALTVRPVMRKSRNVVALRNIHCDRTGGR